MNFFNIYRKPNPLFAYFLCLFIFTFGCNNTSGNSSDASIDITNINLSNRSVNCEDYINVYTSSVTDIKKSLSFNGALIISLSDEKCHFSTNSIPNHDFNDASASFATDVSDDVQSLFSISNTPTISNTITSISLETDNAIFLNGVKLDLLAAACYGVILGQDTLGNEKIGCHNPNQPFRYDPMSPLNNFGTDLHNAHTQPNGQYHYHGNPKALFLDSNASESPVIGFAADGFPIFGPYFKDSTGIVKAARSSYQLKTGPRLSKSFEGVIYNPSETFAENYNGRFVDDWEYVPGSGDLDECNGMSLNGYYGYYITDTYPWIMKCFKGIPDTSFNKNSQ